MNIELPPKKSIRLPGVGDVWAHSIAPETVYMRIADKDGVRIYPDKQDVFYSVNLHTGRIEFTLQRSCEDIVVVDHKLEIY